MFEYMLPDLIAISTFTLIPTQHEYSRPQGPKALVRHQQPREMLHEIKGISTSFTTDMRILKCYYACYDMVKDKRSKQCPNKCKITKVMSKKNRPRYLSAQEGRGKGTTLASGQIL